MTAARRDFKVTTNPIACNFIWSVSQASNEGRGIRLPDARIIWHMGKPNARRFGMQLTTCRKFVYTISTIVEHDFLDHLIEPVGNTVTIMPSDLLRSEVGRGHRDRYIGSLFRVDEPGPVLLVQTVDISNDRQLTLF